MARNTGVSVENNFTRGLITEVTGVNSPENSVTETLNVVYDRKGRASKRDSFRNEPGYVVQDLSTEVDSGPVRNEFLWQTVGGQGSKSFVVLQIGTYLRFFEVSAVDALSVGLKPFSVDLNVFRIPSFSSAQVGSVSAGFSFGKGYLFVTHPMCQPFYIKYDSTTDTITPLPVDIQVRDFEGVPDGLAVDQRPVGITSQHYYNLLNQGWYTTAQSGSTTNVQIFKVLDMWTQVRGDYPSNSDAWWYYTKVQPSGETSGQEAFFPQGVDAIKGFYGNTPVPKGHYILNPFQTDRAAQAGIGGISETNSAGYRPSVVAFYAGRAFYAGVAADTYSSTIYFSQIIERDEQVGQCYQVNDPTSREQFDLLDTDGGTVKIQDIGSIIDLKVVGNALLIFANNGIWSVAGTDNAAFKATDYSVTKVTSFPALSRSTIVEVGGLPIWWNYEGIFSIQKDQVGLVKDVTSLSATTIKTFYDSIPDDSKATAKGSFNDQEGLVYWIYKSNELSTTYDYDRILILDTQTTAFYVFSIPEDLSSISGIVAVRSLGPSVVQDQVVTNSSDNITTSLGDQVYVEIEGALVSAGKTFKFLRYDDDLLTFAEISGADSLDYGTIDYDASFTSGYRIRGNLLTRFQTNYLTVITEETTDGSCYVQGVWDYANNPDSGRYTNPQQAYRSRTFRDYQRSKLKMRGNGKSLQFRFFGETGRPFTIVGWAGFETSDAQP